MSKTGKDRIDDSLAYLRGCGKPQLADLLQATIGNAVLLDKKVLAADDAAVIEGSGLALNSQGWGHKLRADSKTQQRRALRALLLCQGVFLSGMWTKYFNINAKSPSHVSLLQPGWVDVSRNFWTQRSEAEIRAAIDCYAPVADRETGRLAEAFTGIPPKDGVLGQEAFLFLTSRDAPKFAGSNICYSSIMYWMFRAGFVGLPWYLRYSGADTKEALEKAFGQPICAWAADDRKPAPAKVAIPPIDRGKIVHIYCEGDRWKGHWIVCNNRSNGTATGCNNGDEDGAVDRKFSNRLSIAAQFADYKEPMKKIADRFEAGIMDVYNPMLVPAG